MQSNPLLQKLGFSQDARVLILHTDDLGMCQASVSAYQALLQSGLTFSGSAMAPCPWIPAIGEICRQFPEADVGVHLTLNSEWDSYRWGPISGSDPNSGLIDGEGYFHRQVQDTQLQATAEAVDVELRAQVERLLAAGIRPTHIDTHMGTVAHPRFIPTYLQLSAEYALPPMLSRQDQTGYQALGLDEETAAMAAGMVAYLEGRGVPLPDHLSGLTLADPDDRLGQAQAILAALPDGITHFILHPSSDTPELRQITPDWRCRVADFALLMSSDFRRWLDQEGYQLIGYRALQDVMLAAGV